MMKVEIPEGVKAEVSGSAVSISGKLGTNVRKFNRSLMGIKVDGNSITIEPIEYKKLAKKAATAEKAMQSELADDIKGVQEYHEIKMQYVYAHFPMTLEAKDGTVTIKNIFGERAPRHAQIRGGAKVEVKGQDVRVYGTSLEDVAQTAANMKKACRAKSKDARIFQDGIYYVVE